MTDTTKSEEYGVIKVAVEDEETLLLERFATLIEQTEKGMDSSQSVAYQTTIVRHLLAQMAAVMPLASVGTCHCGEELRFKGKSSGLYACCTGIPEHCWKIS